MHLILVSLPGPTNNTPVLRALEYGVIILLWLFFMWVVRAVWVEVRPLKRKRRRGGDADPVVDGKIDLGALAAEYFALGLDLYPRKPGVAFTPPEPQEGADSPFAALDELKKKR